MSELIDYVSQFVKNGKVKAVYQDGKVVKVEYNIGDKKNKITLEDIKQ